MKTINYYEIVCRTYHQTPVMRLRYHDTDKNDIEESQFYTPVEITNILTIWRMGELLGSFGIGTKLASDATFILCED